MYCPNCAKSLLVNETTCTRCGRVVLLADAPQTPPPEPWRRWVPMLGLVAFGGAAIGIVLAIKPFTANGKNDRIVLTLPTVGPPRTTGDGSIGSGPTLAAPGASTGASPAASTGASAASSSAPPASAAPSATPSTTSPTDSVGPTVTSSIVATTQPLTPAAPLIAARATASCTAPPSTDSKGNPTTFVPGNVLDGRDSTAWRCPGDGSGQTLTLTFKAPVQITSVGAEPGYNRVDQFNGDDRWLENRRVTSISWACINPAGTTTGTLAQTFKDVRQVQTTATQGGFDSCAALQATITGTTPPGSRDYTAISEVTAAGRPAG
jgi:hypothetical protein